MPPVDNPTHDDRTQQGVRPDPPRSLPYRRRRRGPVTVVVAVLAVAALVTWTVVLVGAGGPGGRPACASPATGGVAGTALDDDALDAVAPAPPGDILTNVLNAGGQRGQANLVAAQLDDLGFAEGATPGNDPSYPEGDMDCVGQLRFGPAGEAAASTLSLVMPCSQLVRDDRPGADVDVSIGSGFIDINPSRPVRDVLEALGAPSPADDGESGEVGVVDPEALELARDTSC